MAQGARPITEYVLKGEPTSAIVDDFRRMDWMYRNTTDQQLERCSTRRTKQRADRVARGHARSRPRPRRAPLPDDGQHRARHFAHAEGPRAQRLHATPTPSPAHPALMTELRPALRLRNPRARRPVWPGHHRPGALRPRAEDPLARRRREARARAPDPTSPRSRPRRESARTRCGLSLAVGRHRDRVQHRECAGNRRCGYHRRFARRHRRRQHRGVGGNSRRVALSAHRYR
jgi:hypothetical protein